MRIMTSLFLAGAGMFCACAQAQTLSNPESVEYDAARDRYLISNRGSAQILARGSNGALSIFTSSVNSPAGLEIIGNTLFVADGARVVGFDLDSAALQMNLPISGASFLNGMGSDAQGQRLFVSDFSARKLFQIGVSDLANPQLQTLVEPTPNAPNGVFFDAGENRLLVLSWGGSASIYQYRFVDQSYQVLLATGSGNLDGLAVDCDRNLYFSSWTPSARIRFISYPVTAASAVSEFATTGLSNPADISYNALASEIAVPNSSNATISLLPVPSCAGVILRDRFE